MPIAHLVDLDLLRPGRQKRRAIHAGERAVAEDLREHDSALTDENVQGHAGLEALTREDPVVRVGPPPLSAFGAATSGAASNVLIASVAKIRHRDLVLFAVFICLPSSFATIFSPEREGPGERHNRGLQVPRHRDARTHNRLSGSEAVS